MEKVCRWCGQPSDRGRLRNRTEQINYDIYTHELETTCGFVISTALSKLKDFSRSQAVTYTVHVAISWQLCKTHCYCRPLIGSDHRLSNSGNSDDLE